MPNFREMARAALQRAQHELAADDDERLRYAALELRDAMEAITYDRAQAFKAEIPPHEYKTWQPKKVLAYLAEIDPHIVSSSLLRVGRQDSIGVRAPASRMKTMGTDRVLTIKEIKDHYDAIGHFLHIPTLAQVAANVPSDRTRLRAHCEEVVVILESVLSSPVWNIALGTFASVECFRCNATIRKRLPLGTKSLEAQCFECKAEYIVSDSGPGQTYWEPKQEEVECPTPNCDGRLALWPDEMRPGTRVGCSKCGGHYRMDLGLWKEEEFASASA